MEEDAYKVEMRLYRKQRKELFEQALGMIAEPFTTSNFKALVEDLARKKGMHLFETPTAYFKNKSHGGYDCLAYDRVLKYLTRMVENKKRWLTSEYHHKCYHFRFNRMRRGNET